MRGLGERAHRATVLTLDLGLLILSTFGLQLLLLILRSIS
jgi:hypothetical protein